MKYDDPVPRSRSDNIIIEPSKYDRLVGYIWFKGKKIPISENARWITIPTWKSIYDDEDST